MFGLTATQLALLQAPSQQIKGAVAIGTVAPMRYCTGVDPITIDANVYRPRMITFDDIKLDDPSGTTTSVVIDDLEGDIRTAWYAERFSGLAVDIYIFARTEGGTWTEVIDLSWLCTTCSFNKKGQFRLNLSGGAGLVPRAGLMTGNRTDFMFAPEPGEAMRFGSTGGGITFSPGNPSPPPAPGGGVGRYEIDPLVTDGEAARLLTNTFHAASSAGLIARPVK
jgi:hypothetical protein